jgi:hypothetical protein
MVGLHLGALSCGNLAFIHMGALAMGDPEEGGVRRTAADKLSPTLLHDE